MAAVHEVNKAPKAVEKPDQVKDNTKPEGMGPELSQDNIVWGVPVTSDDPTEEKDLEPLD